MKRKKRGQPTSTRIRPDLSSFKPKRSVSFSLNWDFKQSTWIIISGSALFLLSVILFIYSIKDDLQSFDKLEKIDPAIATQVYSADGETLHSFFTSNRAYTPYDKIPQNVIDALISTEDRNFYSHWGIDLLGISRALFKIIFFWETQGGSTITNQLSRNLYFGYEQTVTRKIKEAITSIQLEKTYSKNEILEMYFNVNSFGNNAYGIQSAAKRYFNKDVSDLKTDEAALLIGILKGPSWYSPIRHPQRALERRNVVLKMMLDNKKLDPAVYDSLRQKPLEMDLNDPNLMKSAPYFTEHVRRQLNDLQDSLKINIYEDGLRVYTSINTEFQYHMEQAIEKHMDEIQARVDEQPDFRELKASMSDSAFSEFSRVQIAFVAINPRNGQILAMVGGRDFEESKFNRVTQAKRQPGSAFKPFLYTAAIDNGFSTVDQYINQPTVEINDDGTRWTPENYDKSMGGLTPLREAMYRSLNLVAVRLINDVNPRTVAKYAHDMGISTQIRPYSSLALGTSEVYPLELVSAYGIFANNGLHVRPISIIRIEGKNGAVIFENNPQTREVLSSETTHIMRSMLQDVVNRGTGYPLRKDFKFYQPAGGKTGTTNSFTDAWFVGFTPDIVAGVWVGLDDPKQTLGPGMAGGRVALPFWGEFMSAVYDSVSFSRGRFFESPGVIELEVCVETKQLASSYCPKTITDLFIIKNKPETTCELHSGLNSGNQRGKSF
jgi:penicillin-binding protein 1A